jgi:hypothetical protein
MHREKAAVATFFPLAGGRATDDVIDGAPMSRGMFDESGTDST